MEKAYQISDLVEKLKAKGLDVAEDMAVHVYVAVKEFLKESAVLSENKIDDVVAAFLDKADALVLPKIDNIDGVKDLEA